MTAAPYVDLCISFFQRAFGFASELVPAALFLSFASKQFVYIRLAKWHNISRHSGIDLSCPPAVEVVSVPRL